jgi:shikimate dehydrogenase
VSGGARRAAVLGSPVAHSLSPALHRAAYAQLGLDWRYDALELAEAELPGFVARCGPEWAGLSLTMPLKRAVLPLLDEASAVVSLVGAANTVVRTDDGRWLGHNTDVAGIVAAVREAAADAGVRLGARAAGDAGDTGDTAAAVASGAAGVPLRSAGVGPALVLGAGATAASALAAVAELGCRSVRVLARRTGIAEAELGGLAEALGLSATFGPWPSVGERLPDVAEARVVLCTAPAAASDALMTAIPTTPGVLLDVSYAPWPRPLVSAWRAAGGAAVAGDVMLLHQAVGQVRLMTGCEPDVAVMRAALRAELALRTSASA